MGGERGEEEGDVRMYNNVMSDMKKADPEHTSTYLQCVQHY